MIRGEEDLGGYVERVAGRDDGHRS